MELIGQFLGIFLHIDVHLSSIIRDYGTWTYLILFAIVFCETGLVVTPFLPGDSLLFAAGTFAALGSMNVLGLIGLLIVAAVLGDTANYWIGYAVGPEVFKRDKGRFLNREHLRRAHEFYEKHGGKTIVLARFLPVLRTFAPFVAGVGRMTYWQFIAYNIAGGVAWVALFVAGGYYFGTIPAVRERFTLVIAAIIAISVVPVVVEFLRHRARRPGTSAGE